MTNKLVNTIAAKSMSRMYLEPELADVHFEVTNDDQSEKIPAHKAILASSSSVFKAMFYGPLKEGDTVKITDSNTDAFKEFLQLFYLFEATLSIENIEEVVRLADKYDMLESCATFLKANLSTENLLWCYQFAIALHNVELSEFCESRIQKHIYKIIKSENFLHCSLGVVEHILKLDTLDCDEMQIFNACIEWAKASCRKNGLDENISENLKNQLGACFYSIRFSAMSAEEIGHILKTKLNRDLFNRDELADIWLTKWPGTTEPDFFSCKPRSKPKYTWNATNILVGNRLLDTTEHSQFYRSESSLFFSSNDHVLLGEIHCDRISRSSKSCSVSIFECDENNFFESKSLCTQNFSGGAFALLNLNQPIIIHSYKVYEIRLKFSDDSRGYHPFTWLSEVLLSDKIKITFDSIRSTACPVSKLCFNQIE